jgi:hypothetical protein
MTATATFKSAWRVRGPFWGRPATIFEHRRGAAFWAVSTEAQKIAVG